MDFETKIEYNLNELVDLNIAQTKAVTVYNWITELKSAEQNPAECAKDISDIIKMIKDLHSKVPELEKIYVKAQAMSLHIMGFKND